MRVTESISLLALGGSLGVTVGFSGSMRVTGSVSLLAPGGSLGVTAGLLGMLWAAPWEWRQHPQDRIEWLFRHQSYGLIYVTVVCDMYIRVYVLLGKWITPRRAHPMWLYIMAHIAYSQCLIFLMNSVLACLCFLTYYLQSFVTHSLLHPHYHRGLACLGWVPRSMKVTTSSFWRVLSLVV